MKFPALVLAGLLLLAGCMEVKTNDPEEAYLYWAGASPAADLKVLRGSYWQSSHWTKEYIMYLKVKLTDDWWNEFAKQNNLKVVIDEWDKPADAPTWFQPATKSIQYTANGGADGSRYFRDQAGDCYMYEIQL